jgi:predicted N-formylglutamate amidohydrolase
MSVAIGPEVGDNHPYAMDETDNTVPLHRAGRDIDYLELEVRQDLIADAAGQAKIAREIAHFLVKAQNDMVGP